MSQASLMFWQDQYNKGLVRQSKFIWNITGAAASILVPAQSGVLSTYSALTQAQIDAFLGSTNEINYLAFDSTSMGADAFGAIFDFEGQVQSLSQVIGTCYSASNTIVTRTEPIVATLTNTSLVTEAALTSLGNVGAKFNFGNSPDFDGLTAGTIVVDIFWVSK